MPPGLASRFYRIDGRFDRIDFQALGVHRLEWLQPAIGIDGRPPRQLSMERLRARRGLAHDDAAGGGVPASFPAARLALRFSAHPALQLLGELPSPEEARRVPPAAATTAGTGRPPSANSTQKCRVPNCVPLCARFARLPDSALTGLALTIEIGPDSKIGPSIDLNCRHLDPWMRSPKGDNVRTNISKERGRICR